SLRATASIMCATTGRLLALMDGGALTAIKCSVLAGTILELYSSRKTPRITIYGAGEVAKSIIRGVLSVTKVESITIICRSKNSFDRIKADITSFYPDVFFSFEEFMQNDNRATDADIVFTATSSDKNVIMKAENFRRAELICCMGQYSSDNREFDDSFLNSTRSIIVDDCEVAITMAGLDNCHLVSLQADVRLQRIEKLPRQVLFFSVGSASWDMLVVSHLLKSISFEC
ncbi:ornithine cyclodeaminase/alanine dehydrogenase-like protein (mu-crystallin family), partial [Methylorubrum extorquens]|uniref:hypothetical protein n=1 Tax=Methylorubrum extorquens TaxID=408 RepID=UPI00209E1461